MNFWKRIMGGDRIVWTIYLFFCVISIVEVFSASSGLTIKSGNILKPFLHHSFFVIVGLLTVLFLQLIPKKLFIYSIFLLVLSWIGLVYVLFFAQKIYDGARWISLGPIQLQPSEFARVFLLIVNAQILDIMQKDSKGANKYAIYFIGALTIITVLPIFPENLSTALLILFVVYLMLWIGRIPQKQMYILTGTAICSIVFAIASVSLFHEQLSKFQAFHRMDTHINRIEDWLHATDVPPEKFDIEEHAQVGNACIAISSSHLIGKGPGNSSRRDFLPNAYDDFIFPIIIEELGLIVAIFIVLAYMLLLIRAKVIASQCTGYFPAIIVMSGALMIAIQALVNMAVTTRALPVTGQTLPLLSKGGSSFVANSIYIGFMLRFSKSKKNNQPQTQEQQ